MKSRALLSSVLLLFVLGLAILATGCGGGSEGGSAAKPAASTKWDVRAKDLKFDKRALTVPANQTIAVHFVNDDPGLLHNIGIYTDKSAREKVFAGEMTTGVKTIDYSFKAPAAGEYYFRCDAHPDMNGTLFVEGAAG